MLESESELESEESVTILDSDSEFESELPNSFLWAFLGIFFVTIGSFVLESESDESVTIGSVLY